MSEHKISENVFRPHPSLQNWNFIAFSNQPLVVNVNDFIHFLQLNRNDTIWRQNVHLTDTFILVQISKIDSVTDYCLQSKVCLHTSSFVSLHLLTVCVLELVLRFLFGFLVRR